MKKPTNQVPRVIRFVGLDVGDRFSHYAVKDSSGRLLEVGRVKMTVEDLKKTLGVFRGDRLLMEVGTHSPWLQRTLRGMGIDARVCNARTAAEVNRHGQKSDDRDAKNLAELLRTDSQFVTLVEHCTKDDQLMWAAIRSRDALVRARTLLINMVRGTVKSNGTRLGRCSTESFNQKFAEVPQELKAALSPVFKQIKELTASIGKYDKKIRSFVKNDRPEAQHLSQITGVGDITALACALALGNVNRFRRSRDAAAYLGLVPKKRQSGDRDPQLGITKHGNPTVRRLLVGAAHYIIGPFNKTESDLRAFGLRLAGGGNDKRRKKRAVVAVARKLAVVMTAMLKTGQAYEAVRARAQRIPA